MTEEQLVASQFDHLVKNGVPRGTARILAQEKLDRTPAMDAAASWWASEKRLLVLAGGNGCGKTIAACSVVRRHCVDHSLKYYLHNPGDLPPYWVWRGFKFRDATALIASGLSESKSDRIDVSVAALTTLLILDEAGNESGDGERGLGNLICDRLGDDRLRTIVTTNLSQENFEKRYGSRLASRLSSDGIFSVVHSKDLRREVSEG